MKRAITVCLMAMSLVFVSKLDANSQSADSDSTQVQDTIWTVGGNTGLYIQQVGVKNWSGGGQNSLSYGGEFNLYANKAHDKHTWENGLQAGYGVIKQGDQELRKNNDVLIITSKYGRFIAENWQLSVGLDFRTQFTNGYDYEGAADGTDSLTSAFMSPGFLTVYSGFTYKPNKAFSLTLAPLTGKVTFVMDEQLSDLGAYGVDPGKTVRTQFGASLASSYQKEIMKNVNLKTNLLLFAAYEELTHIDVNYDLFLNFKINEFLTTNFSVQAIYDHDVKIENEDGEVSPRIQLRNTLNVGLTYRFGDKLPE